MLTAKLTFIDEHRKVLAAMERKERIVLARAGGFGRMVMKRSMGRGGTGKRQRKSEPGQAPKTHIGTIKNRTFFAVNTRNKTVVIGPESAQISARAARPTTAKTVPQLLNEGGRAIMPVKNDKGKTRLVSIEIEPRPFVGPVRPLVVGKAMELLKTIKL